MEHILSGTTILVVDDEPFNVDLLRFELEDRGAIVSTAEDGLQALEVLKDVTVDLVLLDVMMPNMDGFEVARRLRQDPKTESLPIILLTAHGDMGDKREGFKADVDDYVVKPFDIDELLIRISIQLRLRRAWFQARLAEDSRARLAMIGALAHELAQPLAGASGYIQLLQVALMRGETQHEGRLTRIASCFVKAHNIASRLANLKQLRIEDYACGLEIVDIHTHPDSPEVVNSAFHETSKRSAIALLDLGTGRLANLRTLLGTMDFDEAKEDEPADLLIVLAGTNIEEAKEAIEAWKQKQPQLLSPPVFALLSAAHLSNEYLAAGVNDILVGVCQPEELRIRLEARIRLYHFNRTGLDASRLSSALDVSRDALMPFIRELDIAMELLKKLEMGVTPDSTGALLQQVEGLTLILRKIQASRHEVLL
jgi:DNA-binding response OmpR family regulator